MTSGQSGINYIFGLSVPGAVAGNVYGDFDRDLTYDAGDEGLFASGVASSAGEVAAAEEGRSRLVAADGPRQYPTQAVAPLPHLTQELVQAGVAAHHRRLTPDAIGRGVPSLIGHCRPVDLVQDRVVHLPAEPRFHRLNVSLQPVRRDLHPVR